MDTHLIGELIRLRYKLLWAKVRSRNGKIALFLAGYLLLIFFLAIFTLGGIGAGINAVRTGKAYAMTGGVLGALFFQALLATVILGFGVNAAFTDTELRRYPLKANERRIARHFLGIADPFWILILALEGGLAFGLYLVGASGFWMGLIAVLLLLISNYLAARIVALLVERLTIRKGGSALLLGVVIMMSLLPAAVEPLVRKNRAAFAGLWKILAYTPPAGAAAAMVRTGVAAFSGVAILLVWLVGLTAALIALERRPATRKVAQTTALRFEDRWEGIGALYGPVYGPLVAHWLRFYSRNNRFRTIYPLAMPLVAFLAVTQARVAGPKGQFANLLGCFALIGCIGTAQFAVNQFGYVGGGLRRFLLLPGNPAEVLRAGSYTFVALGFLLIPVAAIIIVFVSPVPLDVEKLLMMVSAAVFGLFLLNGLGLWATLLGPRKGNFYGSFGNDLSLIGNLVLIGVMLPILFLPRLVVWLWPGALDERYWWVALALAVAAAGFYRFSLGRAGVLFRSRREKLLAVIEGRA